MKGTFCAHPTRPFVDPPSPPSNKRVVVAWPSSPDAREASLRTTQSDQLALPGVIIRGPSRFFCIRAFVSPPPLRWACHHPSFSHATLLARESRPVRRFFLPRSSLWFHHECTAFLFAADSKDASGLRKGMTKECIDDGLADWSVGTGLQTLATCPCLLFTSPCSAPTSRQT